MLPNWLYGKSKSKLAELLGGGGTPSDYNQVKAQVTQNTENITLLNSALDAKVGWPDYAQTGAVNLLSNTATTQTVNGVTFTVNDDKSITCSGTASDEIWLSIGANFVTEFDVTASGCPSGGSSSTYFMSFSSNTSYRDYGEGVTIPSGTTINTVYIVFKSGYAIADSLTFKPMIAPASYTGSYVPYAMTNNELTDNVASINEPFFKDGIRWNYGLFLEWASPSFNSVTTRLGNMTILDIFNAMPVESSSVSYAHGSSIKIATYSSDNRPLFNDIIRWFNLSSIGAGVLEIIKFETSRGLVRYTKSGSAEIYEGWIMSNAMADRYKYEGAALS